MESCRWRHRSGAIAYRAGRGPVRGVQLGEHVRSLSCADPLEYLQCLPQQDLGLRGMAFGYGAVAQARQCVSLVLGAADGAG